jgi:hypothetical protein
VAKAAAVTAAVVVLAAVTAVAAVMTRSPETPILLMRLVCEDEDFEGGYPEGFRSVVVIAKVGASRDETKTQARKSSQLM